MVTMRIALAVIVATLAGVTSVWAKGAAFDDFVSPVSNPAVFEDPRPTTELRPIGVYQTVGKNFGDNLGLDGGDLHVFLVQLRVALSERFALVLNKSGYVWLRPDTEVFGLMETDDGWANFGGGVKYAVYRDEERNSMLTLGLRYESASGDKDVFQGRGLGALNPFLSGLWGAEGFHLLAYTGPRIPISGDDSTFWDTGLHVDYQLRSFYPLVDFYWNQVIDAGRRLAFRQEGLDLFNIGSTKADDHGTVTAGIGFRWRFLDAFGVQDSPVRNSDIGFAYVVPMTGNRDFLHWRFVYDLTLRLN